METGIVGVAPHWHSESPKEGGKRGRQGERMRETEQKRKTKKERGREKQKFKDTQQQRMRTREKTERGGRHMPEG